MNKACGTWMQMMIVPYASTQISTQISFPFLSVSSVQTLSLHSPTDPVKTHGLLWLSTPEFVGLGQFLITMHLWSICAQLDIGLFLFLSPSYTCHPTLLLGASLNKEDPDNEVTPVQVELWPPLFSVQWGLNGESHKARPFTLGWAGQFMWRNGDVDQGHSSSAQGLFRALCFLHIPLAALKVSSLMSHAADEQPWWTGILLSSSLHSRVGPEGVDSVDLFPELNYFLRPLCSFMGSSRTITSPSLCSGYCVLMLCCTFCIAISGLLSHSLYFTCKSEALLIALSFWSAT